ncbi:Imm50 family immunity protein [Streptomyces sp. NPDC058745]|uniref:Imm50 family immunity protein n=1 Tax=unclassified Streptomyces TaxID=2593676 RepID=UPI003676496A
MRDSDWTASIDSSEWFTRIYGTPPELDDCRLYFVQIDERDSSVTFSFETSDLPVDPPLEWGNREYNTVEFFLKFTGVRNLRITGWDFSARDASVTLTHRRDEGLQVTVKGEGSHLDFTAAASLLTRTRAYLAADGT